MTTFTFTSPSGERFEVDAPNGTTEAEARRIFDQTYDTGQLKNLGVGQALEGLGNAAKNAGKNLASLTNQAVTNPITPANILKQIPATKSIGALDPSQITGLLGQASSAVGQAPGAFSLEKGIGQFGFTPQQLEQQGFLKAGTVSQFIGNSPTADWTQVLSNPSVWTGKDSVNALSGLLDNPALQSATQQSIMSQGLSQLQALGVTTGITDPAQLGALVQGATKFGTDVMAKWSQGQAPADLQNAISDLAKNAQFAVNLTDQLPSVSGIDPAGIVNSVDRAVVDKAVQDFLGDSKIPAISYRSTETLDDLSLTIETGLYSGTTDENLTYFGDDSLVWDRVNAERLRRGLPGLAAIGSARPIE